MEITTVKGIFQLTDLQEQTFELLEDWLWFVIQHGAPAPEGMRAIIDQILEGEMPSEEMVLVAASALKTAYRGFENDKWEDDNDWGEMNEEDLSKDDFWDHWNSPEERQKREDAYWMSLTPEGQDEYLGYREDED